MISLLSRQLGQCIVAGWIPALKGVYQAGSCLGCEEVAFAVYKNKLCRLPPWLSDAVERLKSEARPDTPHLNRRVLSEFAVARPALRIAPFIGPGDYSGLIPRRTFHSINQATELKSRAGIPEPLSSRSY